LLIILAVLTASCSLKRSNPLDPLGNPDIIIPETVTNITYTHSQPGSMSKFVDLNWTSNNPITTDGYFVYRSLAYPSEYSVVDTVFTNSCNHGSEPWHVVIGGNTYWYKISAFKDFYEDMDHPTPETYLGRLEGRKSEAVPVYVPA
jgi:hypothetical protein